MQIFTERGTFRRYRVVRVYRESGRFAEAGTFRRYELVRRYV